MKKVVNEKSSFEEIYNEYRNPVFNWLLYKTQNASVSEELANDVMIKAFRNINNFNPEMSAFTTWINNISKNILFDYSRTLKTVKGKGMKQGLSMDESSSDDNSEDKSCAFQMPDSALRADSMIDHSLVGRNTLKAINALKGNQKDVAVEYFLNEMSYDEIVEKLQLTLGTVKGTIFKVREKLQKSLAKEYQLIC